MEEDNLSNIDKKHQEVISAIISGILIIGGGTFIGMVWLIILSIIRG